MEVLEAFKSQSEALVYAMVALGGFLFFSFRVSNWAIQKYKDNTSDHGSSPARPSQPNGVLTKADLHQVHVDITQRIDDHRRDVKSSFSKVYDNIGSLQDSVVRMEGRQEKLDETTQDLKTDIVRIKSDVNQQAVNIGVALDRTEGARNNA